MDSLYEKSSPRYTLSTSHSIYKDWQMVLDFERSEVESMFKKTRDWFILEFSEDFFTALAAAERLTEPVFKPEFTEEKSTDTGLSFIGKISILHPDCEFSIRLPAENCYDPASEERVSYYQMISFITIAAIEVHAAYSGVTEKSLTMLFDTFKDYLELRVDKFLMFSWIHLQIRLACYRKVTPPSYSEFLLSKVTLGSLKLKMNHSKEYFERVLNAEMKGIFYPSQCSYGVFTDPIKMAKNGVMKKLSKVARSINNITDKGEDLLECSQKAIQLDLKLETTECLIF